jgi:hypothetical protein
MSAWPFEILTREHWESLRLSDARGCSGLSNRRTKDHDAQPRRRSARALLRSGLTVRDVAELKAPARRSILRRGRPPIYCEAPAFRRTDPAGGAGSVIFEHRNPTLPFYQLSYQPPPGPP